jgi:uncharacterized protein
MLLNLKELEIRPVRFDTDLPPGELQYDNQIVQVSHLLAKGVAELASRTLGEVRVRGSLQVEMEAPCDRCLEAARIAVDRAFDLRYYPSDQYGEARGEVAIDEEGSDVAYYEGNELDLNEILREVVILALPMQLVCHEACRGICPSCGQNRNSQLCGCESAAVDDRWNKLKHFRAELSTGTN